MPDDRILAPSVRVDPNLALFEELVAAREALFDPSAIMSTLVDGVTPDALFTLAYVFGLTGNKGWLLAADDDARRALIKQADELNSHIGTPWAIKTAIKACGYPDVSLVEQIPMRYYDGSWSFDGTDYFCGSPEGQWTLFRVLVELGEDLPLAKPTYQLMLGAVDAFKNARSSLQHLGFSAQVADAHDLDDQLGTFAITPALADTGHEPIRYDGSHLYDGTWTYEADADGLTFTIHYADHDQAETL